MPAVARSFTRARLRHRTTPRLCLEILEGRTLPSASAHPLTALVPMSATAAAPFQPSRIRHAYHYDAVSFQTANGPVVGNGLGQTIAIVDAYNNPKALADLKAFDQQWGLPNPPSFKVVNQSGGAGLPASNQGWALEESLDVQWAHALAGRANILLVEANSNSYADLFSAVTWAASQPGVSVVSMSFGGGEFSGETSFDSTFVTPGGHPGVTFVASTGDSGAPPSYPAISPNVLAVGGTTLTIDTASNYISESGWSGSGGGISAFESEPTWQTGVQNTNKRTNPDVSFDADPASGVYVLDTFGYGGSSGWFQVGGTSFSAPAWAALIAVANQGRALAGENTLTSLQSDVYSLSARDGHDITSGNNGYSAGPGYDYVTGLGSPRVSNLIADLVGLKNGAVVTAAAAGRTSPGTGSASPYSIVAILAPASASASISLSHASAASTLPTTSVPAASTALTPVARVGVSAPVTITVSAASAPEANSRGSDSSMSGDLAPVDGLSPPTIATSADELPLVIATPASRTIADDDPGAPISAPAALPGVQLLDAYFREDPAPTPLAPPPSTTSLRSTAAADGARAALLAVALAGTWRARDTERANRPARLSR